MTSRAKQGGFQNWQELRDHAIDLFNSETPHPATEQTIIDAYELHPEAVERELTKVAADLQAGTIRSGWAIYAKRAERILTPPSNPTAKTGIDKERAIARAEQWIRASGCHFDRQTEILLELFDTTGLLHAYTQITETQTGQNEAGHAIYGLTEPTGDLALIDRITHLWDQARPNGITIEQDAETRAAKYRQQQAELHALQAQVLATRAPDHDLAPLPDNDYSAAPDDDIPF